MAETAISWTARRRLRPLTAYCDILKAELGAAERCLSTSCKRCWRQGSTVNPWFGCVEKTKACAHCYAKAVARNRMGLDVWGKNKPRALRVGKAIKELRRVHRRALREDQPVGVFSGSMCDVFEDHPQLPEAREQYLTAAGEMLGGDDALVDLMLLTKRPENVERFAPDLVRKWPKRIWLGATIACDDEEDTQIALELARLKEKVGMTTFASVEPMLGSGPKIGDWLRAIDLLIIGGESGGDSRPFDEDAALRLIDAADLLGVRVWFKQFGSVWASTHGGILVKGASHGQDPYRWDPWAQRREMPGEPSLEELTHEVDDAPEEAGARVGDTAAVYALAGMDPPPGTAELTDIADRLLEAMDQDCRPNFHATEPQAERLRAGIAKMAVGGVQFTDADVELIAAGDPGDAEERFGPVPGYAEVDAVLIEIFDGEEAA